MHRPQGSLGLMIPFTAEETEAQPGEDLPTVGLGQLGRITGSLTRRPALSSLFQGRALRSATTLKELGARTGM